MISISFNFKATILGPELNSKIPEPEISLRAIDGISSDPAPVLEVEIEKFALFLDDEFFTGG